MNQFLEIVKNTGVRLHELQPTTLPSTGPSDGVPDVLEEALLSLPGGPHQEYFYFRVPLAEPGRYRHFVYVPSSDGPTPHMHLGMEIAAVLLGDPSKARWKNNILSESDEIKVASTFRNQFDAYSPSLS